MKTEEERFEEWWDNSGWNTDEGVYLSHKKAAKLSWLARAALDRPKSGIIVKAFNTQVWIGGGNFFYPIDFSIARKLVGRELKPGEEVEI